MEARNEFQTRRTLFPLSSFKFNLQKSSNSRYASAQYLRIFFIYSNNPNKNNESKIHSEFNSERKKLSIL